MEVEAWPFHQPIANQLGFVRTVVVQDQVYVQLWRHVSFNRIEEVAKLHGAMATLRLADQCTGFGVQGSEQTGGAVTGIIVRAAFDLSGTHGQ